MGGKDKAPRTPAQKAATRRMIAANRRGRQGRSRPNTTRRGRLSPGRPRLQTETHSVSGVGGKLAIGYGLALAPSAGGPSLGSKLVRRQVGLKAAVTELAQTLNPLDKTQSGSPAKDAAMLGEAALAAGYIAKKVRRVPLVGGIARALTRSYKVDRRTRVRLLG